MACNKPWCFKCLKEEKPTSKIKERLKKKIETRKSLEKNTQNDFLDEKGCCLRRLVASVENIERAKLFLKEQSIVSNKKHLQLKDTPALTEIFPEKNYGKEKITVQKERNKEDSKAEKDMENTSLEIQQIVDFIEGKDHIVDITKKQKNLEKRARRRQKKLTEKQIEEKSQLEMRARSEKIKVSEQLVQNSKSDVKNVTIECDSREELVKLTLSLTGSSALIEKIMASVIQAVPDVKKSIKNAAGYVDDDKLQNSEDETNKKNDETFTIPKKNNEKRKKKNKKKQLLHKNEASFNNNFKNDEMDNAIISESAIFSQGTNGMVNIKRPEKNVRKAKLDNWHSIPVGTAISNSKFNYKIEENNKPKAKNHTLNNKPFIKNKEKNVSNDCETKTNNYVIQENLNNILHDFPEISIIRH